MSGEQATSGEEEQEQNGSREYSRSTISFPYFDLSEATRIAAAISKNVGGGDCEDDQLATWIGMSTKSSGYRGRIAASRLFGVIEEGNTGDHRLTELGLKVVDDVRHRAGKVEAFLNVRLFNKVFNQWKSQQLPPSAALERAMRDMGVAEKQTPRARQVLERSAEEAGFFEAGKDRLVRPGIKKEDAPTAKNGGNGGGSNGGSGGGGDEFEVDPIIEGLLKRLPKAGSIWASAEQKLWLDLLEGSFKLIYKESSPQDT